MKKEILKMTKVIPAHRFRTQLGTILEALKGHQRYIVTKSGTPTAILLSLEDYIHESDDYEDLEDFLDTLMEQNDPEFQKSLRRSHEGFKRGEGYTHKELKKILASKVNA